MFYNIWAIFRSYYLHFVICNRLTQRLYFSLLHLNENYNWLNVVFFLIKINKIN